VGESVGRPVGGGDVTAPKVGDRVRVEFEGVVRWINSDDWLFGVELPHGGVHAFSPGLFPYVEVLSPPEPDYVEGSWYLSDNGDVYQYRSRSQSLGWYSPGLGCCVPRDFPPRPLVRLVPEGQP
jgi:hypothetical protein